MADTKKKAIAIIVIGMAGAGKSTFVQRINSYLHSHSKPPYILNLDPAITSAPFEPNIDIRDTVNYQQVMKQCVRDYFLALKKTRSHLSKIQSRPQWRHLDRAQLVYDEIRPGARYRRKENGRGRVRSPFLDVARAYNACQLCHSGYARAD